MGPGPKEARKIILNCAFLGLLPLILDVNVGAVSRPNLTARKGAKENPEACVASVVRNTLSCAETFSCFAECSQIEMSRRERETCFSLGERLSSGLLA